MNSKGIILHDCKWHLLFESSVWQDSCTFPNSITFTFVWNLFFFLTSWDISVVSSLLSRAVLFYNALWVIFQPSSKSVLWTVAQIGKFSQAFWMILVFWKYTHTHSITILFHIKHHHWINDMFKNTSAWQQLWNAYYCESYWNDRIEIFISLN